MMFTRLHGFLHCLLIFLFLLGSFGAGLFQSVLANDGIESQTAQLALSSPGLLLIDARVNLELEMWPEQIKNYNDDQSRIDREQPRLLHRDHQGKMSNGINKGF